MRRCSIVARPDSAAAVPLFTPTSARRRLRGSLAALALALAATFGQPAGAGVVDGLIHYAPFDNGSPKDVVGNRPGTPGGTPVYRTSTGIIGTYVNLTNNTTDAETFLSWDDPTPATDNFTVQVWLRSPSFVNGQAADDVAFLANKDWDSGSSQGWVTAMGASGNFQWNFRGPPTGRSDFDPGSPNAKIEDGGWHHLVTTYDRAGFAIFYVDGSEVGRVNISAAAGNSLRPLEPGVLGLANDNTLNYDRGSGSTANGDFDEVAVWNRELAPGEISRIYTAGRAGIGLRDVPEPTTAFVSELSPKDGVSGSSPAALFSATILDAATALNPASVKVYLDGSLLATTVNSDAGTNTIKGRPATLLPPLSTHTYRLEFADNGSPVTRKTNIVNFGIGLYLNYLLPPPIALETFESATEGGLPAGWVATNATTSITPGLNLDDYNSDSYLDWVVISSNRFATVFDTRRLNTPLAATNGAVLGSLVNGNIIYAESDNRNGNQVQILFSPDYNMTGRTNVYLSFHSIYEQNQDSAGSVEYSIDGGLTWLPVLYMIDGPDIIRDGNGAIDAVATLNAARGDQAFGQSYGSFIGATVTADLAPYISARVNDNASESKRLEFFRLPQADNKSAVRLRFGQSGTGSWYFGLDDVGFYSITQVSPPYVTISPTNQVETAGNSAEFAPTVIGIGPFTYQWQHDGVDLPGKTQDLLTLHNLTSADTGSYRVKVGYLGGSTNSPSVTLTVLPATVAPVTGQWDFESYDLTATMGADLEFSDVNVEINTGFNASDAVPLPDLNDGKPASILSFPGALVGGPNPGYRMRHRIAANGGGARVNQYTLILDILYPAASAIGERSILQTSSSNSDNRDIAVGTDNGIGVSGGFQGKLLPDTWARVAFAVDLSGPGAHPVMAKFINGVKVGQQLLTEGVDGRWSLNAASDVDPVALLFADDNVDVQPGHVSSIQIRAGRLSDSDIAKLGGPKSTKIPGAIKVTRNTDGSLTIRWSGGVVLQSADAPTGPWGDVTGATSPARITATAVKKFYRPKL